MKQERLDSKTRQAQIVEAALRLVAQHGSRSLSVGRIARQVGVVPSAIYRHFKGIDAILSAVLAHIRVRLWEDLAWSRQAHADPLGQLQALLERHVRLIRENTAIPQLLFSEQLYRGEPTRKGQLYQLIRDYLAELAAMVKQGQKAGRIRDDLDARAVALIFLGLIQPAAVLWDLSQGGFDVTRHARQVWPVFQQSVEKK